MAKKQPVGKIETTQKPKEEKTCFVVIGFGMKTDYSTGRTLNLDLSYTKLIKPAFDKVGVRCFRAIDVNVTGSIDKLMYNWIFHADFVVADLSTMNANVFYELGVRHAQRPSTTLLMAENGLFDKLPFDLSHTIIYGYEHLGDDIADQEAARFVDLLSGQMRKLINKADEDSPVYVYMPGMKAPQWTDPKTLIAELEAKLAARDEFMAQTEPTLDPEVVKTQSLSIIVDSAEAAKNRQDFPTAIALFKTATENDAKDVFLWQRLALVTYKNKEGDADNAAAIAALKEAEQILIEHCEAHVSNDPETLGLAGAINKRLYERTDEPQYFERSVNFYERGFYVKRDYYNGINVAYMYTVRAAELATAGDHYNAIVNYGHANLIRKKVADICINLIESDNFEERGDKEWVYQTLATAHLGMNQPEEAEKLMAKIQEYSKGDFDISTFRRYNEKLIEAMGTFESKVRMPEDGAGADVKAAKAPSQPPALGKSTVLSTSTAGAPGASHAPGDAISIDLGPHRDKPVKSIEVVCKVEFE